MTPRTNARFTLIHEPSGAVVASVERLSGFWERGVGVIGRAALPVSEGLWFPGVSSIHTMLVAFPLDVLFLDAEFRLLRAVVGVPPWRPLVARFGASHTIELGAGSFEKECLLAAGDKWLLHPDG